MENVIISSPNHDWSHEVMSTLQSDSFAGEIVYNGKDCQKKIYQNNFNTCILDTMTHSHSAFEVLRYIKLNQSAMNVILVFSSKKEFADLSLSKSDLKKLGVNDILIKPFAVSKVVESIKGICQFSSWRNIKMNEVQSFNDEKEIRESDSKFTRIPIKNVEMGSKTIFDLYLRINRNKYLKVLHQGDAFDKERLRELKNKKNIEHLYFKTSDRATYINFMNSLVAKVLKKENVSVDKKVELVSMGTQLIYEEITMEGLRPQLLNEVNDTCENLYKLVSKNNQIADYLKEFYLLENKSHVFKVTFFSVLIAKNIHWSSDRVIKILGLSSLLHDIGKIKINPKIIEKHTNSMSKSEFEEYMKHPELGAEMLQDNRDIDEPIRQVIYQHHEYVNAQGYPNALPGTRIYPLAKIVSLANYFTHFIEDRNDKVLTSLKEFVSDPQEVLLFEPEYVKELIKAFIKD